MANAVFRACEVIGYPECAINLAHGVSYLAQAKKDRSAYDAYFAALADVQAFGNLPIPKKIRNAPTKLMKAEGYGEGYRYDHDQPDAFSGQNYWPEKIGRRTLYEPVERGFERELRKRLDWWDKLRHEREP